MLLQEHKFLELLKCSSIESNLAEIIGQLMHVPPVSPNNHIFLPILKTFSDESCPVCIAAFVVERPRLDGVPGKRA